MPEFKIKIIQPKKKEDPSEHGEKMERRENLRVDLTTKVKYQVLENPSKEVISQNISTGGLCILLDRKIAPRMIMELEFELPGKSKDPINAYAEVIWQSNSHTGLKFISL